MQTKTTLLTLADATKIVVPDDLRLLSNFVLREQDDWFEEEVGFVRSYIQPDMQAIDIGANYGMYSLAIAKQLGPEGKLWCFEPTPDTAQALRQSLDANALSENAVVIEAGLSNESGSARFYINDNAEANSLHNQLLDGKEREITVSLKTLDECRQEYQWPDIDFMKLDAEGEEINILQGAKETLSHCSPLVMYELRHGKQINGDLINAFKALGYESYCLIPALNVLTPIGQHLPPDGYTLNLFACKQDRADILLQQGQLVMPQQGTKIEACDYPELATLGNKTSEDPSYQATLYAYLASRNDSLSNQARFDALLHAFYQITKALEQGESRFERLSTYARIAYDMGQQQFGMQINDYMLQRFLAKGHTISDDEPFVAMSEAFETVDAQGKIEQWAKAMILDQYIRKHSHSCYFTREKALPLFNALKQSDFMLPEMEQRLELLQALLAA